MADSSVNVIDLSAYRARKAAAREQNGASVQADYLQQSVFCFWPMMVWMPVPVFAAPLTNRDAL